MIAFLSGILFALVAVAHSTYTPSTIAVEHLYTLQKVRIQGTISAEPDRRPLQTKYTVHATALLNQSGAVLQTLAGKVLMTDRRQWPEFYFGDTVILQGAIELPGVIDNTFAYDKYLSRYGVYAVMYSGSINSAINPAPLSTLQKMWRLLLAVKQKFESQINKIFPEPHASFMAGLLTGSRRGIPPLLTEMFNVTGLTHIIAISGYNITIIITIIGSMLCWLPRKYRLIPAVLAIVLFTIFVGASAAVVRAAIMGCLGLLALHTKQKNIARISVLWTIFFMTMWNVKYMWFDAGFQLSFMAVVGLLEVSPLLEQWFKWLPKTLAIRESLQMTIAAQISTAPLLLALFGRVSLIAPIANLLIAPFIPIAMLLGSIGTVVSYILFPLGQIICYPAWACLQYILYVAKFGSIVPYASIQNIQHHWSISLVYYSGLICICIWWNYVNSSEAEK